MSSFWVDADDWHTAGEPFRIVENLPPGHTAEGDTVAERRLNVIKSPGHLLDTLRQSLCHEPRGHADMYGGFIVPPDDTGAHFGVLFWHKDGFSTACGHGTIALGYWAISKGIVQTPKSDGVVDVIVDVPSGRVIASVAMKAGKPLYADFVNVSSYQLARNVPVDVTTRQLKIEVDLSYGGAVYASVNAIDCGLRVEPRNHDLFVALGREIKASLGKRAHYGQHELYGVIFFDEDVREDADPEAVQQRNVTVFADGQIDRSPCGSGTCARIAILLVQGRLGVGKSRLVHRSIIDTEFEGDIVSESEGLVDGFPACTPRVRGQANLVGCMKFFINPADTVFPGFTFR